MGAGAFELCERVVESFLLFDGEEDGDGLGHGGQLWCGGRGWWRRAHAKKLIKGFGSIGQQRCELLPAEAVGKLFDERGTFREVIGAVQAIEGGEENERFIVINVVPDDAVDGCEVELLERPSAVVAIEDFVVVGVGK